MTLRRDRSANCSHSAGFHVGFDLTPLLPRISGVDRYLKELVTALARFGTGLRFTLFVNRGDRDRFADLPSNFTILAVGFRPRMARLLVQQAWLPPACVSLGIDVLHSSSFLMPWLRGGAQHLLRVHDMTLFSMPEVHSRLRSSHAFRRMVLASLRRADLLNVPSRSVRDELLARIPWIDASRVRVTPWGVAERFSREGQEEDHALRSRLPWIPHAPYVLPLPRRGLRAPSARSDGVGRSRHRLDGFVARRKPRGESGLEVALFTLGHPKNPPQAARRWAIFRAMRPHT